MGFDQRGLVLQHFTTQICLLIVKLCIYDHFSIILSIPSWAQYLSANYLFLKAFYFHLAQIISLSIAGLASI